MNSDAEPILEACNISRAADDGSALLDRISVGFPVGSSTAILGPPGSGKTLLLRAFALLDPLDSGDILFEGKPIADADVPAYRRQVLLVPQRPVLVEGTVKDNIRLPFEYSKDTKQPFDEDRVVSLLEQVGRDATFLSRTTSDLSGGESQIVSLIRGLQLDPLVLLLDEPTSSLDSSLTLSLEDLVTDWRHRDERRTLVLVTHLQQQAYRLADRIITMSEGGIVSVDEVIQ